MKKVLLAAVLTVTLSGCAGLVDYAAQALSEMKDTSRYEEIRDSVSTLCDASNYDMFVDRFGRDTVNKWMKDACSPVTRKVDPSL